METTRKSGKDMLNRPHVNSPFPWLSHDTSWLAGPWEIFGPCASDCKASGVCRVAFVSLLTVCSFERSHGDYICSIVWPFVDTFSHMETLTKGRNRVIGMPDLPSAPSSLEPEPLLTLLNPLYGHRHTTHVTYCMSCRLSQKLHVLDCSNQYADG
jgi:hypothetical protein